MSHTFGKSILLLLLLIFSPYLLHSQEQKEILLSGNFRHVPMIRFFQTLEANYPVRFYFQRAWFARDTVNINLVNESLAEAVKTALGKRPYTFRIMNGNQVIFLPTDQVAMLAGQMHNYSSHLESEETFTVVGDKNQAGKVKIATVTGKVTDGKTGDPIIGAVIQVNNLPQGAVTNVQGAYKLSLAPGLYTLSVSSVGFEQAQSNVKIVSNGQLNFELFDKSVALEDIIIYGQRVDRNVSSQQMSLVELDTRGIKELPSVSGGRDVLKGLTTMPGVKSIGEFSSGINVRGGGEDENLYLVNGAPLFNTSHVFGLFSVINPDAVDKLTLYKGHIPAYFGERVSSVVDIRTLETAPPHPRVEGGIGTYDSRLMTEVPLYKDKIFFDLGGRTSYSNWILKNMQDYDLRNSRASFYDLNGTFHANLGKSHFAISAYTCSDDFRFASDVRYQYGSQLGSLNWNYLFNSNLASYLTLAYSSYRVNKDDISSTYLQSRVRSGIDYYGLKYRMKYGGIRHHTLDAGFSAIKYKVYPGKITPLNEQSLVTSLSLESEQAYEGAVFVNDEFTVSERLIINAGLRYSEYMEIGPLNFAQFASDAARDSSTITGFIQYGANHVIQRYGGLEPRLSARFKLNEQSSIKMSFNRNMQYLSLLSNSSVATPSDNWKLADPYIRPLIANQYALGYYHNFRNNRIETSVEVYYKSLKNVVEYKDGANLEMNRYVDADLLNAEGKNYGVEVLLKKNSGKVDGWITYTYSRSLRKTSGQYLSEKINDNKYFPSSYDRPHDFTAVVNYHINRRAKLSGNFTYSTGRPITLPEYKYFAGNTGSNYTGVNEDVVYFSSRNKYRIPDYNRLDLTFTLDESLKIHKKWKGSWSFSVLNVYGRKNAYTVFYKKEDPSPANDYNRFSLYKLYLIGKPVPTLSYTFLF